MKLPPPQVGAPLKKLELSSTYLLMLMILYVLTYQLCCDLVSHCPDKVVTINRGDVVLCDLNPVIGTEQAEIRPIVIL